MLKFHCRQFIHTIEKVNKYCHQHHWCLSKWCVSKHTLTYGSDAFTALFHLPHDLLADDQEQLEEKENSDEVLDSDHLH